MTKSEKKELDIVFVVSPANADSAYMPFYYLYLAGYLEKHGLTVEIIDSHLNSDQENFRAILGELEELNPRFIGLASFVTDYNLIVSLADEIKKTSTATLLVGNAHPSIAPEDFLYEGSPFDIVVRGEGELTVKELLTNHEKKEDLGSINGIAYLDSGEVKITPKRMLMDLAECGKPAYQKLDMRWYRRPTKYVIRRLATVAAVIYTGRGCPFDCSFCASNSVWQANAKGPGLPVVRKRPVEHVIEELRLLQDVYHFDFFYILDDTFGIREKDVIEFCTAYRESGLTMQWAAETRVNCIKSDNIPKTLRESGCIQLDFGVESGSPELLKRINKATTVEQTLRAFQLCRKHGIRTFANILLNLPGEEISDLELTHKLLAEIKPTFTSVGITQPYPGTPIYKEFNKHIPKEDYNKLNRLYPTDEFQLNNHKLNLQELGRSWFLRYGVITPFEKSLVVADKNYWIKIVQSKYKWSYALFLLKELIMGPIRYLAFFRRELNLKKVFTQKNKNI